MVQLFNHAKISILLSRMRKVVLGTNALLTNVALTNLRDGRFAEVTFRPNDDLL